MISSYKQRNKIITPENALTVITSTAAGAGGGSLFYNLFKKNEFIKQGKDIIKKYSELIENHVKKSVETRKEFEEVLEDDIKSLRRIHTRRERKHIKEEIDVVKENAKKLFNKSTKIGLGLGLLVGGAYIGYKNLINKKQKP